jgi:hypothetical protein
MSLKGGKKRVKRSGEREIIFNVHKLMKTESEVGITIPVSKVQKRVMAYSLIHDLPRCWAACCMFLLLVVTLGKL